MKTFASKLLENCQEGVLLLNGVRAVVYRNSQVENFTENELLTLLSVTVIPPGKTSVRSEVQLGVGDTSSRTLAVETLLTYSHQEPMFLVIFRDVTDEKADEIAVIAKQRQQAIDKLKNDLISVVSHELRTPLAIVKSSITNLKAGVTGQLNDKQDKILATTMRNIDRLGRLIHDFLDLSRLEAGVAKIQRKKVDLDLVMEKVHTEFEMLAREKGILFAVEPVRAPSIIADPELVVKVLQHLLQNALQFARGEIRIKTDTEAQFVKVCLADDGVGIAADKLGNLFKKFTQLDRADGGSGYKGTGLGLAISNEIMNLHQGEIWVESEVDKGTNVYLLFPVFQAHDVFSKELEKMQQEADDKKAPFSLLAVAIRNFKEIREECRAKDIEWMKNDVTGTIDRILRPSDLILAMDQHNYFYILLSGADRKEALLVLERVHRVAKDCFCPGRKGRIFLDLSVGVAVYPSDTARVEELVKVAVEEAG